MVSSSAARTAQRWAASRRLSFKTGLVISDAKAQQRLACSRHRLGSPGMRPTPGHTPVLKLIPKSDVLVKKVVVRRNIARLRQTQGCAVRLCRQPGSRTELLRVSHSHPSFGSVQKRLRVGAGNGAPNNPSCLGGKTHVARIAVPAKRARPAKASEVA
jgi:hypothetical protein